MTTSIYKSGTIALDNNSNIVTGTGTLFQSVANALPGDLFTLDGSTLYEVYQVDTETQLRIRNVVTGIKYQGPSVQDVNFAIIRNFTAGSNAQIASDVVDLQQRWHEREREMSEWFASDFNYYQITNIQGDKVLVITPTGLNNLVDGPVNIEDFGLTSAKESQALDLNQFPAGIFYSRPIFIAGQPSSFGSGIKLVMTNKSDDLFYQKVIELDTAQIRYRIATSAENAQTWNTVGGESGGLTEVTWNDIQDIPATALRWPSFSEITGDISELLPVTATRWPSYSELSGDINEVLPTTAKRWPSFTEVTGAVSESQLPSTVTANKRSLAESPGIKREQSLTQRLSDYPTLKKTEVRPTESPNNKRLMLFDDVRGEFHVAFTDIWFTVPTTIASRAFPVFFRGLILRFNNSSAYSGNVKMRVYPMGSGGDGLPNNPTLENHQWHEYETTVTELYKIGEFNSQYFEGIIEYIELDTGWHQFDVNQSDVNSLNAKFDVAFGTFRSPFRTFYQKTDTYWYSEDMFPDTLDEIGPSWEQDSQNPRVFTVTDAEDGNDGLRFFGDNFDEFSFELVVVAEYLSNTMALTISNSSPNKIYYAGSGRYITDERIFFKRAGTTVTGEFTVESIKMRLPHYG